MFDDAFQRSWSAEHVPRAIDVLSEKFHHIKSAISKASDRYHRIAREGFDSEMQHSQRWATVELKHGK